MNEWKAFFRSANGSWACTTHTVLNPPTGQIEVSPGSIFQPGTKFMGLDLARWLDEKSGRGPQSGRQA